MPVSTYRIRGAIASLLDPVVDFILTGFLVASDIYQWKTNGVVIIAVTAATYKERSWTWPLQVRRTLTSRPVQPVKDLLQIAF